MHRTSASQCQHDTNSCSTEDKSMSANSACPITYMNRVRSLTAPSSAGARRRSRPTRSYQTVCITSADAHQHFGKVLKCGWPTHLAFITQCIGPCQWQGEGFDSSFKRGRPATMPSSTDCVRHPCRCTSRFEFSQS